jgi:lipoprotein-anchoring transpeptidase ErfK/SrfK
MSRGATVAAAVAVVALVTLAAVRTVGPQAGRPAPHHETAALVARLPAATAGALAIGRPSALPGGGARPAVWIAVRATAIARARPSASAPRVGAVTARTPEGTTNLLLALGRHRAPGGALWVRVRLALLPNGQTGWVPRRDLGAYGTTTTRLTIDRRRLTATLRRGGQTLLRVPVGIGTAAAPTPAGTFVIRNVLRRYRSPFYGPIAFGTSARSATLTDWPGGGYIGIHGTNRPALIPGRVSHGCIRMRNADVLRLARLMAPGTPLTIL